MMLPFAIIYFFAVHLIHQFLSTREVSWFVWFLYGMTVGVLIPSVLWQAIVLMAL